MYVHRLRFPSCEKMNFEKLFLYEGCIGKLCNQAGMKLQFIDQIIIKRATKYFLENLDRNAILATSHVS